VLPLIKTELGRTRIFVAWLHPEELEILFSDPIIDMPQAKVLDVYCPPHRVFDKEGARYIPSMGYIRADNLMYLAVYDSDILGNLVVPQTSYGSIRYIYFDCSLHSQSTYMDFLASCPNVHYLTIRDHGNRMLQDRSWPTIRYTLPKLTDLRILGEHTIDTVLFFRSLHMPSLQLVEFGHLPDCNEPTYTFQLFSQLLLEYTKSLEALTLDHNILPAGLQMVIPVLGKLDALRILVIQEVQLPRGILQALLPLNKWACPLLFSVTFKQVDFEDETLFDFIDARCLSDAEHQEAQQKIDLSKMFGCNNDPRGRLTRVVLRRCSFADDLLLEGVFRLTRTHSRVVQWTYDLE